MSQLLAIYGANFKKSLAVWLQYRIALLLWLLGMIVAPIITLSVWVSVARAQGGDVSGIDASEFAAYFIAVLFIDHLTFTWIMWEYDWRVREGAISKDLLLPVHPIHADITDNIVYKLLGLVVLIPVGIGLVVAFRPNFTPQVWSTLLFIPVFVMAFFLRFFMGYMIALAAFWATRISALNSAYFTAQLFFSGRFAPLELLPPALRLTADFLPFQWGIAFPVELILGQLTLAEAARGTIFLAGWLAIITFAMRTLWSRAVRKYAAFGS